MRVLAGDSRYPVNGKNEESLIPLIAAATSSFTKRAKCLIENIDADVNCQSNKGMKALMLAVETDCSEIVCILLKIRNGSLPLQDCRGFTATQITAVILCPGTFDSILGGFRCRF